MSDESTWIFTPPLSPPVDDGNFIFNCVNGENIQFNWFTCAGEVNKKDMILNPDGFVMKGELKTVMECTNIGRSFKNPIILFGRNFDQDSALLFQCKFLFQAARKDLMILDSASRLNSHLVRNVSTVLHSDGDCYSHLRKQICELLSYTRCYIARILANENSLWLLEKLIPTLSDNLYSLRLLLRSLKDLPDYVIAHSANAQGNKCTQASYHLFHAHLDLRWYHLTTLHQLVKCQDLSIMLDDSQQNIHDHKLANKKMLEEHILLLLSDLITIAIERFEKMHLNLILKKTPFSCTCVRELWLMLQMYVCRLHDLGHVKPFWTYLNQLLDIVLGKKSSNTLSYQNCSMLKLPEAYTCTDRVSFCLWLLVHIAQLNGYTEEGQFIGAPSGRMESNYHQLEAILKGCVSTENNITEPQLRVIIQLMTPLLIEWWEARSEPFMILWEYYHHRLNSAFFVPGATPDTAAVMSKTGAGLLEQVKSRLEASVSLDEDSFSMFLCLLGKHLVHCTAINQQRHWQQMKGRIYSKFSPTKMLRLSEMGLYHFVSLFLTLALTVDLQEVGKKLQELLSLLPLESMDLNRRHVILKANIALVQLYVERGLDIVEISRPLQLIVTELCTHKSGNIFNLMRTFVEGVQDIVDSSQSLHLSQHSLIGGWITHYLSNGSLSDSCRLLDTIVSIMMKLRQSLGCSLDNDSTSNVQSKMMVELLLQYILPYIQSQCSTAVSNPPFQVADLAASFTLLALEQPHIPSQSFDELFTSFVSSDKMNIMLTKRYLCHVLLEEAVMKIVVEHTDYENIVTQAWIRCSLLSVNESSELSDLTRIVNRFPAMQELCHASEVSLANIEDPLFTFIKLVGFKYKRLQDIHRKTSFREKCQQYFTQVDKCVGSVLGCSTSSNELVNRIYVCATCMVFHCGQILYIKSKPNCLLPSLVNNLLLPHAVYRPDTQLHPFIASAIKKTLHQFILGIAKLNPKQDDYIARTLRDIVTQYLPKLVTKSGNNVNMQGIFTNHPLLKCFTESEESEVGMFVLETLSNKFFTYRGNIPHDQANLALVFLMDLMTLKKCSADLMTQITKSSLLKVFELAMFVEDGHAVKRQSVEFMRTMFSSDVFKQNEALRESFVSIFMALCQKHLAFSSVHFFRLTTCLAQLCPEMMTRCLPHLKDLIKTVERRRGVGFDPGLRNNLGKLTVLLGIQDT